MAQTVVHFVCGILGRMNVNAVELERIDFSDETFRISEDLDPAPLEESLRAVGQLNPVILVENAHSRRTVVAGFRRLRALGRLGKERCLAQLLPSEHYPPLAAFRIALWDNLAHRRLLPLEKARVLHTLKHVCGADLDSLVNCYLPLLELDSHKNVLRTYEKLHLLDPRLKALLGADQITPASAERLAARSGAEQGAMASLLGSCRFSASLQRQVLDLIDELAAIESGGWDEIAGLAEIGALFTDPALSAFQRGEAVFRFLRRRRNPRLSEAEAQFQSQKEKLRLPGAVRLTPDSFFERPLLRVEFEARSAEGFREITAALYRSAQESELEGLFRVK